MPAQVEDFTIAEEDRVPVAFTKPPRASQLCLFHSPKCRGKFQNLLNEIRKLKCSLIPRQYIPRVGGAVCVCRPYKYLTEFDDDELLDQKKIQQDVMTYFKNNNLSSLITSLMKLTQIADLEQEVRYQQSCDRLWYILSQSILNNVDPLKYQIHTTRTEVVDDVEPKNRYPHSSSFTVDFPSNYLRFVFGKQGRNIKMFSKKHDCILKVVEGARPDHYTPDASSVKFSVNYRQIGQGEIIEKDLLQVLRKLQKQREVHLEKVAKYWEMKRKRSESRRLARLTSPSVGNVHPYTAACELKLNAKDNYSTKYQHMLKSKSSRKEAKTNPKPKILEEPGTWCANCLTKYDKEIHNSPEACKHHPGFIMKSRKGIVWSCCGADTKNFYSDQSGHHRNTGCATSRHLWKPHKKPSVRRNVNKAVDARHAWSDIKNLAASHSARVLANLSADM